MDGGDISSFVTNGEWDLIGNNQLVAQSCRCASCLLCNCVLSYFASFSFRVFFSVFHQHWDVTSLLALSLF